MLSPSSPICLPCLVIVWARNHFRKREQIGLGMEWNQIMLKQPLGFRRATFDEKAIIFKLMNSELFQIGPRLKPTLTHRKWRN